MSPFPLAGAALALGVAAALGGYAMRQRARRRQVERLLEDANQRLEHLQVEFGRFAPDSVVERLTEGAGRYPPSRRTVVVLFADLMGFTAMCARMDPAELVPILNEYFRRMTQAIGEHQGRVTELTGDGLLALFGALDHNPWMAKDAVQAALDMRAALAAYNQELTGRGLPELRMGVGIHQGDVLAGVFGNEDLRKFGVVGDPINVAARVEKLTRDLGTDVLITEDVRQGLSGLFELQPMPPAAVKGKEAPLVTYGVVGPVRAPTDGTSSGAV